MGLYIAQEEREKLSIISIAMWKQRNIKYLGISISDVLNGICSNNLVPLINSIRMQFTFWDKL